MPRVLTPELMDQPDAPREELDQSLRFIRRVNVALGGVSAVTRHFNRWSKRWPKDKPITILDLGTGSADIPVALHTWGTARGFDIRTTGIDVHPTTLALAREYVRAAKGEDAITLLELDARTAFHQFGVASFDYVHAGMFLHHFSDVEVMTLVRIMDRIARRGIIWNDLVRSPIAAAGIRVLTARATPIVRHDARVSVTNGFTKREVLDVARRLDLKYCGYAASLLTQRFTLAGEKHGGH